MNDCYIFHLITSGRPSEGTTSIGREVSDDLLSTVKYLELTKSRNVKWVFLSSGGTVYGSSEYLKISEDVSETLPICSYGLSKLVIEKYLSMYGSLENVDYNVIRLSNPYGYLQNPLLGQGLISSLLYKALLGDEIVVWGDGETIRDYIFISDAVEGILRVAENGGFGQIYNIGSGIGTSINQLIVKVEKIQDSKLKVSHEETRNIDVKRNVLDISKIANNLDWQPKVSLDVGISLFYSWMKDNYRAYGK